MAEIFENIRKNPRIEILHFELTEDAIPNDRIPVIKIKDYSTLKVKLNSENNRHIFNYAVSLNIPYFILESAVIPLRYLKLWSRIFENNFKNITIFTCTSNIGIDFVEPIINSKFIKCINFKAMDTESFIEKLIKNNKSIEEIIYSFTSETEEKIIREALINNFTIKEISGGGDYFSLRNKFLLNAKTCMLMMRRRADCIISRIPRRLLIYLLEFLSK